MTFQEQIERARKKFGIKEFDINAVSDFLEGASTFGFRMEELRPLDLPPEDVEKVERLMAQVAERAYRRGASQAHYFLTEEPDALMLKTDGDWYYWRYMIPTDTSIGLDGCRTSAVERLESEIGNGRPMLMRAEK